MSTTQRSYTATVLVTAALVLALTFGFLVARPADAQGSGTGFEHCDPTLVALVWAARDAYGYQPMMGSAGTGGTGTGGDTTGGDTTGGDDMTGGDDTTDGGSEATPEATQQAALSFAKLNIAKVVTDLLLQDTTPEPSDDTGAGNDDTGNTQAPQALDCEALRADVVAFVFARNNMTTGGGTGEVAGDNVFTSQMSGPQEVPGPGDPDATGTATVTIDPATNTVCWSYTASGISTITAAHIHVGAEGESGSPVVPFSTADGSWPTEGCTTAEADVVQAILSNPVGYYVNVHTDEFPQGALRGQLLGS